MVGLAFLLTWEEAKIGNKVTGFLEYICTGVLDVVPREPQLLQSVVVAVPVVVELFTMRKLAR